MRKSNEMWETMGVPEIMAEVKKAVDNKDKNKRGMSVWTKRATYYSRGKELWERYVYRADGAKFDGLYYDEDVLKSLKCSLVRNGHYAGYSDDNNNVVFENTESGNVQRW